VHRANLEEPVAATSTVTAWRTVSVAVTATKMASV
jgi:hypothetical protein